MRRVRLDEGPAEGWQPLLGDRGEELGRELRGQKNATDSFATDGSRLLNEFVSRGEPANAQMNKPFRVVNNPLGNHVWEENWALLAVERILKNLTPAHSDLLNCSTGCCPEESGFFSKGIQVADTRPRPPLASRSDNSHFRGWAWWVMPPP